MENAPNNLDPALVVYVMKKYYSGYYRQHYADLYSYGLQALYEADKVFDPAKIDKPFKWFAVSLIRRAMFMFVRDRLSMTYVNTTFTDDNRILDKFNRKVSLNIRKMDLYRAIKTLNDDEKNILYLTYYKDYTLYQIADEYNIAYQTALRRLHRILNKLKELLKNNE